MSVISLLKNSIILRFNLAMHCDFDFDSLQSQFESGWISDRIPVKSHGFKSNILPVEYIGTL